MSVSVKNRIVQVTNVSPSATSDQLRTLFGHVGVLEEVVVYPSDGREELSSKVCYIRYQDPVNAEVALHLNNTVFLDRALIVLPIATDSEEIPTETEANTVKAPMNTAAGVLPRSANWPLDVISMVVGRPGEQVIQTLEPRLSSLSFPQYPPLPATTDGARIEEIRRTVLITNLDPKTNGDQVLDFFNKHAEVRCVRMAGTELDRAAYVEFTEQPAIIKVFGLMGATLNGRQIMVQHSNCAIIKPANNAALLVDVARRARYDLIIAGRRERIRSRDRRSRSRRRSTSKRRRSRSKDRRHSPSRSRRRSRSRSRSYGRHRYSRSRSRDRRRNDRGRSRSHNRRRYNRSRSRSDRRYSRSRSRGHRNDRRDHDRFDRRDRDRNRDRERERDKEREKDRDRERLRDREKDRHRDKPRDSDRKDRDKEKNRRREREKDSKRGSQSSKHEEVTRDDTPKQSESHHSNGQDANINQENDTSNSQVSPSQETNQTFDHNKRENSVNSSHSEVTSDHCDSVNDDVPVENGKMNPGNGFSNADPSGKPTVLGVKLAGPEDMDYLSPSHSAHVANGSPCDSVHSSDSIDAEN